MIEITNECHFKLMNRYRDKYGDRYFDLAIVDPEYGIGESGKNHKSRNTVVKQKGGQLRRCPSTNYSIKDWDSKPAGIKFFSELLLNSKNQIIFGANYFENIMKVSKPPRRNEFEQFIKDNPIGFIIWDKVNGTSDFSDCEIIYTSFNFPSFVLKYMWAGMMQGKNILNGTVMQGNKKLNEKRIHPTQKPVIIYKYLLNKFAKKGFKILDTHLGSGSIAIACHDLGFDLSACELDIEYYNKSMKRLSDHQKQLTLF